MRLGVLAAMTLVSIALAAPAHADASGTMTHDDWLAVANHESRAKVETACSCTGFIYGGPWVGKDGHQREMISYGPLPPASPVSYPTGVGGIVQFRQWKNGTWHVNHIKWWLGSSTTVFEIVEYPKPPPA